MTVITVKKLCKDSDLDSIHIIWFSKEQELR